MATQHNAAQVMHSENHKAANKPVQRVSFYDVLTELTLKNKHKTAKAHRSA